MSEIRDASSMKFRAVIASVAIATLATIAAVAPSEPASAAAVVASELPSLLTQQADANAATYDRDLFEHWIDEDADGCDTRREVLIEESEADVTVGPSCSLTGGHWLSSYDNVTTIDPADVDIDHLVPLAEAWRSGAWEWTPTQRRDFANDLEVAYVLIAVTDNVNQSKGDRDPAGWMPPYAPYHCQYVIDWALIKYRYSLTVDSAEMAKLTAQLTGDCGSTTVTLPIVMIDASSPAGVGDRIEFPAGTTRLAGITRYETAIEASRRYSPGVPAVFIATGTNFPDALSGAAAAALLGGPLLLTAPASLPSAVATEVARLSPARIYVLGSAAAVSESVESDLANIAPVTRFGGENRYDTGLMVVEGLFANSTHAIIATGRNFPDALAATGAAGKVHAPVILVDGLQSTVPSAVLASLTRLGATTISIAGSATAVSAGIEIQLANAGYSVARYGGQDRYETTAIINNAFFPANSSDTAFVATGANFPDALAGAALAGLLSAPMYITTQPCSPTAIYNSRINLGSTRNVVLGDLNAVSDSAAQNNECPPPPPPPPTPTPTPPSTPSTPANPGDSKNCSDFGSWSAAQSWYRTYFPYYGDVARLDGDNDGIACESLPGAP
ncbi:MAG: cell wall-binding repeat-containing protein [Rhodoglobus sp.]